MTDSSTLFNEEFYTQVDAIMASPHQESALSFGSFGEYLPEGCKTARDHNKLLDEYIQAEKHHKKGEARELDQLKSSGVRGTK